MHGEWMDKLLDSWTVSGSAQLPLFMRTVMCGWGLSACARTSVCRCNGVADVFPSTGMFDNACPLVSLPEPTISAMTVAPVVVASKLAWRPLPSLLPHDRHCLQQIGHLLKNSVALNTDGPPACMCGTCRHSNNICFVPNGLRRNSAKYRQDWKRHLVQCWRTSTW